MVSLGVWREYTKKKSGEISRIKRVDMAIMVYNYMFT